MVRGWSLIEVSAVYLGSFLASRLLAVIFNDFLVAERELLGFNYLFPAMFYAFPLLIIAFTGRKFSTYGVTKAKWEFNLNVGMSIFVYAMVPFLLGFILISLLGLGLLDFGGALIITGLSIVALILILMSLKRRNVEEEIERSKTRSDIIVMVLLLLTPLLLGLFFSRLTSNLISLVIWQFIISGFGEELKYRGYYQSTINLEFGRPYEIAGIKCGPGLIISSVLFSISHVLNPFNPFNGSYEISLWWGTFTFVTGLTFGLIREKTESILAAGLYHGLPDAVGEGIASVFGWI